MYTAVVSRYFWVLSCVAMLVFSGCSSPETVAPPSVMIGATGGPFDDAIRAVYDGNLEYIKQCVESDARYVQGVDDRGRTLLHHAAEAGREDIVKYLLENGASVLIDDNDGYYPLEAAAQGTSSATVIELLREAETRERGAGQ